jgi:asparagine synthase (glutamine-hydrolysing)
LRFVSPHFRSGLAACLASINGRNSASEKLADLLAGQPCIRSVVLALRRSLSNQRLTALGVPASRTDLGPDYLDVDVTISADPSRDAFNAVAWTEATHYMADTLLRDTDSNSMRQSLEVRVPFLDLPLVDYVSALPGHIKQRTGAVSKSLLRMACQKVLRRNIVKRPKTGFTLPIGPWMRNEMRDSCEAAISRLETVPFLDQREVRRIWNAFLADEKTMHWSRPLSLVVLGSAIR